MHPTLCAMAAVPRIPQRITPPPSPLPPAVLAVVVAAAEAMVDGKRSWSFVERKDVGFGHEDPT